MGSGEPHFIKHDKLGDQGHLTGDHHGGQIDQKEDISSSELNFSKGIPCQSAGKHGSRQIDDGDLYGVPVCQAEMVIPDCQAPTFHTFL